MGARRPSPAAVLGLLALVGGAALPAPAAEWGVTPEVGNTLVYDDNRRLAVGEHDPAWGTLLDAGVALGVRTERTEAEITPRIEVRRFSAEQDLLDRDDRHLQGVVRHLGERSRLELNAALSYRGSLTTDLESTERTNVNSDTRDRSLGATWSYAVTPSNTLQVSGNYSDIDYDLDRTTGLRDYRFASIAATGVHQWSARDQISLSVFRSRFRSPEATTTLDGVATTGETETTTTGFQLGWNRTLSETLTGSVSVGTRHSETRSTTRRTTTNGVNFVPPGGQVEVVADTRGGDLTGAVARVPAASTITVPGAGGPVTAPPNTFPPGSTLTALAVAIPPGAEVLLLDQDVDQSSRGLALNASLEQTLDTWSWRADFSRSLSPQSNGDLRERDNLDLVLRRRFSQRLTGLVDGRYFEDGGLDDGGGDGQRTFLRVSAGLRWQVSPYWTVTGRYQHRRNETRDAATAESNGVLFTLAYRGEKTAWSR